MKSFISIDAETNGLWGEAFSIAAIVYNEKGEETDRFLARIPDTNVTNSWVKENVLPAMADVEVTHESYEDMLKDFARFYIYHKDATTLWHMGHVVEAGLFRELRSAELIGDFDAPYVPIEVSMLLLAKGYAPDSVDAYAKEKGLKVSDYGTTHNPLYDCEVAARVFFDLQGQ